jgi:8-oxo-dGTP pyrophosphatase MutT (NUDIX family)/phosphohistidine phosphatase SixA
MANTLPPAAAGPDVIAAGAVAARNGPEGHEVLLVHRPKYDDWSFPKGKQDPGEHVTATAVREVREETGVDIRLGRPLRPQMYAVSGGRAKTVYYWVGHVIGDDDVSSYVINDEVDELGWFPAESAAERLTYLDDIDLLEQYRRYKKTTSALVVARHAKAHKRDSWEGPDPLRPLNSLGEQQAQALVPILRAYGVARVVSSPGVRCVQTVAPYAAAQALPLVEVEALSEDGFDEKAVRALLADLMATPGSTVVCSHRPVLPHIFDVLGIEEEPLAPAELVVLHHRKGDVVATERHVPATGTR